MLPGEVTLGQLWNMVPTNPPVSTAELTGDELRTMLEENLESTFSADPYRQMGGFVKRCRGINLYFKMENPAGNRIEELIVEGRPVADDRLYRVALLGEQGMPDKYGSDRRQLPVRAVDALQSHFAALGTVRSNLRNTVVAV